MNKQRIFITGLLALIATSAFAIFAYMTADWTRGGSIGACPAAAQTVRIIPQIAIGSVEGGSRTYETVIQIVNTSGAAQIVSAGFYRNDGAPLNTIALRAGSARVVDGVLGPVTIAKDGFLEITGKLPDAGLLGWARITGCGGLSVTTFLELRDGPTERLYSRVAASSSAANLSRFLIPRIRDAAAQLDVGVAIVNAASGGSADLTMELVDSSGTVLNSQTVRLAGGEKLVKFARELFTGSDEPRERTYQYLRFSSSSATFAAVALGIERDQLTSVPVETLE